MSQGPQGSQVFQCFQGRQGPQPVNTGLAHYVEFASMYQRTLEILKIG
jgi:hypothetical protein